MKENLEPFHFLNKDINLNQKSNRFMNNNILSNDKEDDKIYKINHDIFPSNSKNNNNKFKSPIKSRLLNFEKNFFNSNIKNNQNNFRLKSSRNRHINNNKINININDNNIKQKTSNNIKTIGNFDNSSDKKIKDLQSKIRKTMSKVFDKKFKEKNEDMILKLNKILLDLKKLNKEIEELEKNINIGNEITISKYNDMMNQIKSLETLLTIIDKDSIEEKIRKEIEEKEKLDNIREIKQIQFEERCKKRLQEMRRRKIEEEKILREQLVMREIETNERRLMIEERIQKLEEEIRIKNLRGRGLSNNRRRNINTLENNNEIRILNQNNFNRINNINIRNNRRNNQNPFRINQRNSEQDDIKNIFDQLPEFKITDINKINRESPNCIICLDNFMQNDILCYLPCFHPFHKRCIFKWIKRNSICPICLLDIKENLKDRE